MRRFNINNHHAIVLKKEGVKLLPDVIIIYFHLNY